jgi:DNA-binding NarL/FixJ family response regulator
MLLRERDPDPLRSDVLRLNARLAMLANVLSWNLQEHMRTRLVATANLKKPIRTAIVEDDPVLRRMIVSLLQADPNYAVVAELAEGKAAIDAISHMELDIVLVDIGLPDISGIDVIRELKARCPGCNVLVVTTFGDEKTVTSALEAGADGYLLKGTALEERHPRIAGRRLAALADDRAQAFEQAPNQSRRQNPGFRRRNQIDPARARNPGNDRQGIFLRRDVEDLQHQRRDGAQPPQEHLPQARSAFQDRGGL